LLGMLADKDWRTMVASLVPLAARVVTSPVASERTVSSEDLRAACVATGAGRPVKAAVSVAEALKLVALDPFVLVTGSLYFLGEVMEQLGLAAAHGEERTLNEWSPPKP
jgi:folylpolyglutamate synthase/dihydropteroate synthase